MKEYRSFLKKKIGFETALDVIKCLKQIKQPRLVHTYVPIYELPAKIITMINILSWATTVIVKIIVLKKNKLSAYF